MEYVCKICHNNHKFIFELNLVESQSLSAIRKDDFKRIFESENNFYLVDKSIVVFPAIIYFKTNHGIPFSYETWVECDWEKFVKMADSYKNATRSPDLLTHSRIGH